ncbi:MAG TPA: tryptophan synthase subunit alpha [Candidatus Diapherotrites archaeon]|uniref:Tryptophan synthase alpha chain n=1 Tax=Candidatus Iainarchaeum sp. TaxID=3101447 RepID=A0A7J4JH43_9ARCH|nr:tryptophan synthase subunit alpha [Candidatus Diapherotrites archaeon]
MTPASIGQTLARLRAEKKRAFLPFLVAGHPSYEESMRLALAVADHADVLELGLPFSDPIADGKTIQKASSLAIKRGMDTETYFGFVSEFTRKTRGQVPVLCMTYYNLVHRLGVHAFTGRAAWPCVSGLIVVDLPLEESTALQRACALNGLDLVLLVSPSTPPARARKIAEASRGFVYLVSSVGVTGAKKKVSRQALRLIRRVKKTCKGKPLCVGFGVSNAGQAATLARAGADGVIVGSALIDKVGEKNFSASLARVRALAASISGGLKHV